MSTDNVDPGGDNPENGCWVAPDSAAFDNGVVEGGVLPYAYTRCGVPMSVSWPRDTDGVFPYVDVYTGLAPFYPWAHRPGSPGLIQFTGWPYTITFGRAVGNVRVYTRRVDFAGGKVQARNAAGVLLAEQAIPVHPSASDADSIVFADATVARIDIIPADDPNFGPAVADESIWWQARFEPAPCDPPSDTLLLNKPIVRQWLRDMLDSSNAWGPTADRREKSAGIYRNVETGQLVIFFDQFQFATPCSVHGFNIIDPPSPPYTLIAIVHTHPYSGPTATHGADIAPANCPPHIRGRLGEERGASPADWDHSWKKKVPGYYISKHYIGRYDGQNPETRDPKLRMINTKLAIWYWPDGSTACRWTDMRPPPVPG